MDTILILSDNQIHLKELSLLTNTIDEIDIITTAHMPDMQHFASHKNLNLIVIGEIEQNISRMTVCRTIKLHPVLKDIPVIFQLTEHDSEDVQASALNAGADYLLSFPFKKFEFIALVRTIVKSKRQEKTKRESSNCQPTGDHVITQKSDFQMAKDRTAAEIENALAESEKKYRNIVDSSTSIILEWDTQGTILFVNQFGLDFFGYSPDEILGKNVVGTIVNTIDSYGINLIDKMQVIQSHPEYFYSSENENVCRNGRRVWIAWTNKGIYSENGELLKTLSIGIDRTSQHEMEITLKDYQQHLQEIVDKRTEELLVANNHLIKEIEQRKKIELDLHDAKEKAEANERKYRMLFDATGTANSIFDGDCRLILQNTLSIKELGKEAIGSSITEIFGNKLGETIQKRMNRVFQTGIAESFESEFDLPEGRRYFKSSYQPVPDEHGIISTIQVISQDVTELKVSELKVHQAKIELEKSEAKFRAISENSLTGIYIVENNRIEYINQALCDMFGYQQAELIGQSPAIIIHPDDQEIMFENVRKRLSGEISTMKYEIRGVKKGGEINYIQILGGTFNSGDRKILIGNILDLTENKRNSESLYKSNRLYAVISQVNQAIVHIKNKEKLFHEICRIAVEYGKFRMAWIGLVDEQTQTIKPYTHAGWEDGYFSVIKTISIGDVPEGRGPTGTAIRKGLHFVCQDYVSDPMVAPWRENALERGYYSSIALPIKQSGKIIGAFTLYSSTPGFFDQPEIDLLLEVASDINYALDIIELEQHHQEAINELANKEEQFRQIFEHMPSGYILFELIYDENGKPVDHRLIEANKEFEPQTGLKREEEIGRTSSHLSFNWPDDVRQLYYQVAITGNSINLERFNDSLNRFFDIRVSSPRKGQFAMLFNDISERKKFDTQLIESKAHLRAIVDSTTDMIWTVDSEKFGLLDWNPSFENYFFQKRGIKIKVGDNPNDLFPAGSPFIENWISYFKQTKTNGHFSTEYSAIAKDQIFLLTLNHLHQDDTSFGISVFAKDISEIRAAEAEALKTRKHFQTMFEEAPLGMALVDTLTGKILEANSMFAQITGWTEEELKTNDWMNMTHPDDLQIGKDEINRLLSHEITGFRLVKRYLRPDGKPIWVNLTVAAIQYEGGKTIRHISMIDDITERKANEERIMVLSRAVEQSQVSIVITDKSGNIEYVNPKFCQITGYSKEEALGQNPRILKSGHTSSEEYQKMWDTLTSGKDWMGEFINIKKNGEHYTELASITPITNEKGIITHFLAIKEDITDQKKATEQIKTLSAVVEQSPLLILITDSDLKVTYVNKQFTAFTQYPFEEIKGKRPWVFNPKHWEKETHQQMWDVLKSGNVWQIDSINRKKDGTPFWEHVTVFPLINEKGILTNYIIAKEDITEKKQLLDDLVFSKENAEYSAKKLREAQVVLVRSENLLKDIQTISKTGGWEYSLNDKRMFWTPELYRIHEIQPDPLIDHINLSVGCYLPKDREIILKAFNQCITKGIGYDMEFPFITVKGNKRWIRTKTEPIFEDGRISKIIGILIDITDQKLVENELIKAKEKAEESDRLKTSFLANMSHEIRTPLNSIIGFSELLLDPYFETEQQLEFVNTIKQNGNNLLAIINDIMDISQIESGQITLRKEQFTVDRLMGEIVHEQALSLRAKGLEMRIKKPENNIIVTGDSGRIKQILSNFISNAIKFTDKGYIEVGCQEEPGNTIQFYVKDSGIGIPKEYHHKIFERFRQVETALTRKYGGNGLGLTIARQLAERMGGHLWLESTPGEGSIFYISIPLKSTDI